MKKVFLKSLKEEQIRQVIKRPVIKFAQLITEVRQILEQVKSRGDEAVRRYTKKFDQLDLADFAVSKGELRRADEATQEIKQALKAAAENIKKFHQRQVVFAKQKPVETSKGIQAWQETRPIERVGLYVPRGLFSTVLMLAIPAKLAGCKKIVMTTPADRDGQVDSAMLLAAKIAGITELFKIGGAQAIGAMAYGTESIPKVDKVFGPGNQYVTVAKMLVSIDPAGAAIDLPAGPSEILVVADDKAKPAFVAADLLSQLEHGQDSQALLITDSKKLAMKVEKEIKLQSKCSVMKQMARPKRPPSRPEGLGTSIQNLLYVITKSTEEAIAFANFYAPEHLVLNIKNPAKYLNQIKNAGSVFVGEYSPVAAGDYASGTNHVLPTSGWARAYSGLSVHDFLKNITFQKISRQGLKNIAQTIATLAEAEEMPGHKGAITVRQASNRSVS